MSIVALPDLSEEVIDFTIDTSGSSGSGVPTSRLINTTAPYLTGGGPLSSDLTLAVVQSGGGAALVGVGRVINGTSPIRVNGAAAADLTAALTISALPFTGAIDGMVTHNPSGVQGKFLKDDNTWGTSPAGGVTSVVGAAPVSASPTVGDVIVTVPLASIASSGLVPATGGTDATKFLCATSPLSWAVPGTGSFVRLQGSTPGSQDTGNFRVSGVGIIGTSAIVGGDAPSLGPPVSATSAAIHARQYGTFAALECSSVSNDTLPTNIVYEKNRYSAGTVQPGSSGDILHAIYSRVRNAANNADVLRTLHAIYQDGAADAQGGLTAHKFYAGEALSDFMNFWLTRDGAYFGRNVLTKPTPSARMHIAGSMAWDTKLKTADYPLTADDCVILGDGTLGSCIVTLPSATGTVGRVYAVTKIDTSSNAVVVSPTGGNIGGSGNPVSLFRQNDFIVLVSDGANWWIVCSNIGATFTNAADQTPVANSVTEDTAVNLNAGYILRSAGGVYRYVINGVYSTTGTPTLRFRIKNSGNSITLADSTALTMPNNAANYPFIVEYESADRAFGGTGNGKIVKAILHLGQAAGPGAQFLMYNMFDIALSTNSQGARAAQLTLQWGTGSASNTAMVIQAVESKLSALVL